MACEFPTQITNRNFLSPSGFKFTLTKEPKVSFFCTVARIPELSLDTAVQPSYLKNLDIPGEKLSYGDLTLRFLVDEDMENYMAIHNWITQLGYAETTGDFKDLVSETGGGRDMSKQFSDASLHILNSNFRTQSILKFKDVFPYSLTSLDFDSTVTDVQYFTAQVSFKYTIYNIVGADGRTAL